MPTNRLARETSPYLLQHAHNPVDWYPWGAEAFEAARARRVPIFLSIGYATCYWCHVMERESFEDAAAAKVLNERFIPIKVDREQHPEVDDIYMAATVIMTGSGGWPMSVFLEPDTLKPFYCGTYFPPEPAHGRPSFVQALGGVSTAWREKPGDVLEQASHLADAVREEIASREPATPVGSPHIVKAVQALLSVYDKVNGGFGGSPKFPQPSYPGLLLEVRRHADDTTRSAIDQALTHTLDRMSLGGMFDQVGGGFHRYSVDRYWLVPHFEKMLYDQAQLAQLYAQAATIYEDDYYLRVAKRTCDYVLREMSHERGGFYSAQDAEVDGREGLNYLWTPEDFAELLGDDAVTAAELYGVTPAGNFKDPHNPNEPVRSVLHLAARPANTAELDGLNTRLYDARQGRKQPRLDDKVLTAWNGLMISGLCATAEASGDNRYRDAASRCAAFLLEHACIESRPRRVWRDGTSNTDGVLEDSAALALGLAALARLEPRGPWLDRMNSVLAAATEDFGDGAGGFFDTREGRSDLFVRSRSSHDGAVPSGASMMLTALCERALLTGDMTHTAQAVDAARSLSGVVAQNPAGPSLATRSIARMLSAGLIDDTAPAEPGTPSQIDRPPVEIFASEEIVEIGPDLPAEVYLSIRVREPYHILASDPGPSGRGLLPLRVGLMPGSGTGVTVYCDYPDGNPYHADKELMIHTGVIECRVVIERNEQAWEGTPKLGVSFQACTDTVCAEPQTAELAVELVQSG
ncbi:MAG: thioredoxin domain-containing protein [Planctomycetota bacterium]